MMDTTVLPAAPPPPPPPAAAGPTLPRLLVAAARRDGDAPDALAVHRRTYAVPSMPRRHAVEPAIAAVERSGLRGRGGGGFPTGRKMRAVSEGGGRPVVLVNGSEGEPASAKDSLLLTRAPHLVLDGALVAAWAVGAKEVVVCIERSNRPAIQAVERAIADRVAAGEPMPSVTVREIPSRYVAGEETALVHVVNGGDARPTLTPPRPYQKGVGGRPTLVDNVETLCHVAQIARWGPTWFRGQGTDAEPGTMLLTLSGALARRGVCEVPIGMSLERVLTSSEPTDRLRAVLLGGYYGTWITPAQAHRATLDDAHLRSIGSGLGCGAVVALPTSACGLIEAARVLTWLAGETAGQCGPCVHGLAAIARGMTELAHGRATAHTVDDLHRWAGQVEGRGACSFPDGAVRHLRSALRVFDDDVAHHLRHGPCGAVATPPVLKIPSGAAKVWR